jgi:16S rRNA (guanine527-N7)-methyltransferase
MFHVKHIPVAPFDVSRETWEALKADIQRKACAFQEYGEVLLMWNERVNVVSRGMNIIEFEKHQMHSLMCALSPVFQSHSRFVDIGSGGGLPGIPLAMAFPDKEFLLVDIIEKKCIVLKELVRTFHLKNVRVECADIKKLSVAEDQVILSKHAFKLGDFSKAMSAQPWKHALFLKGKDFMWELEDVSEPMSVNFTDLDTLETDGFYEEKCLVELNRKTK